jgi:hypothetical protein
MGGRKLEAGSRRRLEVGGQRLESAVVARRSEAGGWRSRLGVGVGGQRGWGLDVIGYREFLVRTFQGVAETNKQRKFSQLTNSLLFK